MDGAASWPAQGRRTRAYVSGEYGMIGKEVLRRKFPMFGSLGSTELIVVLVVVLIVFGAGKLPSVMRDLGKGVSEFKKAQSDGTAVAAGPVASTQVASVPAPAPVQSPAPVAPVSSSEVRPPQSAAPRA